MLAILACFSPIILKAVGHRYRISQQLESWRIEYGLNVDQVNKLREIEFGFHGSANPFSEPEPTAAEIEIHDKQIASVMGSEAGKRYFEKISASKH